MNMIPATTDLEKLKELAFEFALQYYPPEDLAIKYGVPKEKLDQLQEDPRFSRLVLAARREIDEQGTQMKVMARKLVGEMVPELANIITDPTESTSDRLSAFKQLVSIADMDTSGAATGSGFSVNIQVNN